MIADELTKECIPNEIDIPCLMNPEKKNQSEAIAGTTIFLLLRIFS